MLDRDTIQSIEKNVAKISDTDFAAELTFAKLGLDANFPESVVWYSELLKREAEW